MRSSTRRRLAGLALPLAAFMALPAVAPAEAAKTKVLKIVITGVAKDAVTGKGIANACVYVTWSEDVGQPRSCTPTNGKGKYKITAVWPARSIYPASVEVASPRTGTRYASNLIALEQTTTGKYVVDGVLWPTGSLTGRVVDQVGNPVAGMCPQARGGDPAPVPAGVLGIDQAPTCSDADGVWRVDNVVVGSRSVALLPAGKYQGSYVPSATLLAKAQQFEVAAGAVSSLPETSVVPGGTFEVRTNLPNDRVNQLSIYPKQTSQDIVTEERLTPTDNSNDYDGRTLRLTNVQADDYLVQVHSAPMNYEDICEDDPGAMWAVPESARPAAVTYHYCDFYTWTAPFDGTGVHSPITVPARKTTSLTLEASFWAKS